MTDLSVGLRKRNDDHGRYISVIVPAKLCYLAFDRTPDAHFSQNNSSNVRSSVVCNPRSVFCKEATATLGSCSKNNDHPLS